jgi:hypothetical protein
MRQQRMRATAHTRRHLRDLSRRLTMAGTSDNVLTHEPQRRQVSGQRGPARDA